MISYKEKFIAFIDVLGFKQLVADSGADTGMTLPEILALLDLLGSSNKREAFDKTGPSLCPYASYEDRNLDFRLTRFSDCVVVSAEVSPSGVVNLLSHCTSAVVGLLFKGIMCRGYLTRGKIYHTEAEVLGTGFQAAINGEAGVTAFKREADELGTPFVEIDTSVSDYVADCSNDCVRMMYGRMVKSDGELSAIYPFEQLSHSFFINSQFDPDKERRANDDVRSIIRTVIERLKIRIDQNNPKAVQKGRRYIAMLNQQLSICNATATTIDTFCRPFPHKP